uniref:Ubiquitin activating enzyme 4 n=1 Tax=Heliothis virescens TaxID=7102 RepID=A0A2A4K967_HELVI
MEQLLALENEIKQLRKTLTEKEKEMEKLRKEIFINQTQISSGGQNNEIESMVKCGQLPKWAIERYSRQILLRDIGVAGQARICQARVLIVGAGGLGCPAAMYLAAAGVGEIGIIDYDVVELTNIHRQILHFEHDENTSKAESAAATLRSINSRIKVTPYNIQLDSKNALSIAANYDVILDCTDNVPTRYLLSDLSCLTKLPLISGSALKMEGQLTIYGYRSDTHAPQKGTTYRGPCYRCVFPSPPSPDAVGSCSTHGVAGPVPGVIGTLQAMEAIKCILDVPPRQLLVERMLIFDAEDMTARTVRLRKRNPMCAACSDTPTVTQLVDYEAYCMAPANDKKKQEIRLKTEQRKIEKEKRMTGQSYFGFRTQKDGDKNIWIQDVFKSERRLNPPCNSEFCAKSSTRYCKKLTTSERQKIFEDFWRLEWKEKKKYVRSLIDNVPVKRRRSSLKGITSRKGDSKMYHLIFNNDKVQDLELHILPESNRISAPEVSQLLKEKVVPYMVDVRADAEYQMCHIVGSNNWPIDRLSGENLDRLVRVVEDKDIVVFICRRGNDSQVVAKQVLDRLATSARHKVRDMVGGLHAWATHVDRAFPVY